MRSGLQCIIELSLQLLNLFCQMATESTPPQPETEENPQPPPDVPLPSSDSLSEALRLRELAEARFKASSYTSALKYAKRASHLSPALPGLSNLINICKILSCDPSDPYRIFSLAPNSSLTAIRRRYKNLALSLHPDKLSGVAAEEAFKRVSAAFQLLTESHKKEVASTFWTACGACRLLHEFDRKYVGYRLVCPRCRKSFLANEVPAPADNVPDKDVEPSIKVSKPASAAQSCNQMREQLKSSVSTTSKNSKRKAEKTLAEIQAELAKNNKQKAKEKENKKKKKEDSEMEEEDNDGDVEDDASDVALAHTKYKGRHSGQTAVEDSDFYNFDKDRVEKCFRKGQIWAIYDDDDGMPRYYGLIEEVLNSRPFNVRLRWLELHDQVDRTCVLLVKKTGNWISCALFKVGKTVDLDTVNMFSHSVWYERAAVDLYRIYPKKGSIWALYSDKKEHDGALVGGVRREYDIVLALTSYSDAFGLSFAYLEKVEGYKTIFKRHALGSAAVRYVDKEGIRVFSHQIPARLLKEKDAVAGLEGVDCWELDPASLPPQLLRLGWDREKPLN